MELATLHGYWNGMPLCFGGDFNEIRYMVERRGCRRALNSMKYFDDLCNELGLIELPLSGAKYTWSRPPNKKSKIDRFLFSSEWEHHFPNINFKRLARPISDYFPIELCLKDLDWGTAGECFSKKLHALKEKLKVWNRDVFGNIDRAIDLALTKMKELDELDDERSFDEGEEDMLVTAKMEFDVAHRRQSIMLRKKSRLRYFRDGDRNTKHFHRVVRGYRAFNNINNLRINGRWTENKEEIKLGIANHFELAFEENSNNRPRIKSMCLKCIYENASIWLERSFDEEEVKNAIKDLGIDRAPGPNGFPMKFFLVCWDFLKEDLMKVFEEFHDHNILHSSLKNNFIALIPKKAGVEEVKDFRPISLIGSVYKIISKVLAERLKREQVDALRYLLLCFELTSDLKIYFSKSSLFGVAVDEEVENYAYMLGCKYASFPSIYLGLPLGDKVGGIQKWGNTLEINGKRITSWNGKTIARGGKLTLIKSILASLPIYYLSIFLAPCSITKKIDRIVRNFLWEDENRKRIHNIGWKLSSKEKEKGGLGIRRAKQVNSALLKKWWWRFGVEKEAFWRKIIVEKFGETFTGWESLQPKRSKGGSLWFNIYKDLEDFNKNIRFKIGAGKETRFWKDSWLCERRLCDMFPFAYEDSRTKEFMVASMYEVREDGARWEFMSRQRHSQTITSEVLSISNLLSFISIQEGVTDTRIWVGSDHGQYTVKDGSKENDDQGEPYYPINVVWSNEYPHKINFFLWLLSHDRVMKADKLLRRGMDVSSGCRFCEEDDESSSHLFYDCWRTRRIWDYFVEGCHFGWSYDPNIIVSIKNLKFNWGDERLSRIWNTIPVAIWWCI
ncbi:uncharacterized protein LOC113332450 [Papaver somniferum]|uniref:uncharacterized protein LOC113332450 n=1 Tax=Papaver somniferum TaxID=3469 RepID=UPI000E6FC28A|nr:uncharacterized protein LOC113332450 [Papaver somniferum]